MGDIDFSPLFEDLRRQLKGINSQVKEHTKDLKEIQKGIDKLKDVIPTWKKSLFDLLSMWVDFIFPKEKHYIFFMVEYEKLDEVLSFLRSFGIDAQPLFQTSVQAYITKEECEKVLNEINNSGELHKKGLPTYKEACEKAKQPLLPRGEPIVIDPFECLKQIEKERQEQERKFREEQKLKARMQKIEMESICYSVDHPSRCKIQIHDYRYDHTHFFPKVGDYVMIINPHFLFEKQGNIEKVSQIFGNRFFEVERTRNMYTWHAEDFILIQTDGLSYNKSQIEELMKTYKLPPAVVKY